MKALSRFLKGFGFVFVGLMTLREVPGLKRLVVLPFLLDIIIFFVGIFYGTQAIHSIILQAQAHFFGHLDSVWITSLTWLVQFIFWILFFIFYLYFTYLFAALIGAPFYSALADKTLAHFAIARSGSYRVRRGIKHNLNMLFTTVIRAGYLVVIGLCLFFASFFPGLNFIAAFAAFVLIAFDMSDYALELKGYHLRERFRFLGKNLPEYCGMGAFIGLTAFVPGLILLCVPFGVIGSTLIVDQISEGQNQSVG